jgi:serine protease Do
MLDNKKNPDLDTHNSDEKDITSDFDFLQEKIKERPINKRKLIKKTILTASMAVLFGVLACLSFLLLEPVINNWLYPEEEPEIVTFPQEKDEMLPEDMLTEGTTTSTTESEVEETTKTWEKVNEPETETSQDYTLENGEYDNNNDSAEVNDNVSEDVSQPLKSYVSLYEELYKVYTEVSTSLVTVTGVRSDVDWFNDTYQSEGTTAGVIIANNNRELLILSRKSPLNNADTINISFGNGAVVEAEIKQYDGNTDIAVLAVDLKNITPVTLDYVTVAALGSSTSSALIGTPIIAVGNIYGYNDGVSYGIITSNGNTISMPDSEYHLITTDVYASSNPTGILINMNKEVIGIIDNRYNKDEAKNLLSAIGITELKGMITRISNGEAVPYLGIYVQDISEQTRNELGLPKGAYIYDMDMKSSVIQNGIQKGDIIVKIGSTDIESAADYMNALRNVSIDRNIKIVVQRASLNDYQEMEFTVIPTDSTRK